ncbi:MAG: DUF559 domain-containing protein [Candidatus Vogelbacteria bacterium]|nr:DUF559 domain-containing protein [Candidatus Vogelbacteria bacterium]
MGKPDSNSRKNVLVAVLKDERDFNLLFCEYWYRIPQIYLPKRKFTHIAFYQPAIFGKDGKCVRFYGRIADKEMRTRLELLPNEPNHPRANDSYCKFTFEKIVELRHSVRNIIPRRVSFGFTDIASLRRANDILELYHVPKTEQIVADTLKSRGIPVRTELTVIDPKSKRRVRVDLAIECTNGDIAIECDNDKAHKGKLQQKRDGAKDMLLDQLGWHVMRLKEHDILNGLESVITQIQTKVHSLGHQVAK